MSKLSKSEISDLDKWIAQLKDCQPLEECQVKTLCEKVIKPKNFIFITKNFIIYFIIIGQRDIKTRTKRKTSSSPSNNMW